MNKQIYRTAKQFIKAVHGKKDFTSAETFAESVGYKITFYNTTQGDAEIARYHLEQKALNTKAFTYASTAKIIFIDNTTHPNDKLMLLYHELGHILLGHIGDGRLFTRNAILMDIEADAFVQEVLTFSAPKYKLYLALSLLVISISAAVFFSSINKAKENTATDTVYITKSGDKYHKSECFSTKDKTCASIDKSEAEKLFAPCQLCNP